MPDAPTTPRSTTGVAGQRRGTTASQRRASRTADLAYSSLYGGALGGSAIAIFFLILDVVQGEPLLTPSVIGAALFTNADPATVSAVRVDMVAYFSLIHFAAFFALGAVASRLYLAADALRHTIALAGVIFALLTATLVAADWLFMSGVVVTLGIFQVLAANAVTAWVMASFVARALSARTG
jgi:hypothetical protein